MGDSTMCIKNVNVCFKSSFAKFTTMKTKNSVNSNSKTKKVNFRHAFLPGNFNGLSKLISLKRLNPLIFFCYLTPFFVKKNHFRGHLDFWLLFYIKLLEFFKQACGCVPRTKIKNILGSMWGGKGGGLLIIFVGEWETLNK